VLGILSMNPALDQNWRQSISSLVPPPHTALDNDP
jgi:hypothetical protein